MSKNTYVLDANVYSVVSIRPDDVERVTNSYLYGHTVVDGGFDLPDICNAKATAVVLKTTASATIEADATDIYDGALAPEVRHLFARVGVAAQDQIDRFASGLYAGRVCGSKQDAEEYVLDVLAARH